MNPFDEQWIAKFTERATAAGYPPDSIQAHVQKLQQQYLRDQLAAIAKSPSPVRLRDIGRSFAKGATFNFNDEIAGAAAAVVPGGRGYTDVRDEVRANDRQFRAEHPRIATGAEIAGGLTSIAVPGTSLARGAVTLGQQMRRGAALGAAVGAVSGLGAGEGSPQEQALSTAGGAVAGGALGAVAPPLMQAGGATLRAAGRAVGIRPQPAKEAQRRIAEAMRHGRTTPAGVQTALNAARAEAPGLPVAIADVAGTPGVRMTRGATGFPTEGAQIADDVLVGRDLGRGMRLEGGLSRATGQPRTNLPQLLEELDAAFRPRANQMYEAAYAALDDQALGAIDDPVINAMLDTDAIGEIWEAGVQSYQLQRQLARAAGRELPDLVPIVAKNAEGQWVRTGQFPDTRTLDFLKRGMDAFVERRLAGPTANKGLAHEMSNVRARMLERLDEINPQYRDARSYYRGGLDANRALESGQGALTRSGDEIAAELGQLDTFGQNLYRLAAQDALRQRLRSQSGITQLLNPKNREFRERVKMLFPDAASYQQFMREVGQEARLARTEGTVRGGSVTQRIAAEQGSADPMARAAMDLGNQGSRGFVMNRLGQAMQRMGMTPDVADQIAARMLELDPAKQSEILAQLTDVHRRMVEAAMRRQQFRMGGSAVGGLIPGRVTAGDDR